MGKRGSPRLAATRTLVEVAVRGRSLSTALPEQVRDLPANQHALVQELCYGTLRWYYRLDALATAMLERPLKTKDADVRLLLLLGLYQLAYMNLPPHAAVSETVAVTAELGKGWARGLCNALLRRFQREGEDLLAEADTDPAARYALPRWLHKAWRTAWPRDWQTLAEGANTRPPFTLRVNRRQGSCEDYLARLKEAGLDATGSPFAADALTLDAPVTVERLPGFATGACSVQDAAAQLAADLVDPQPGMRVLDACAAPGGKTAHLLERCPGAEVLALDIDAERLRRVEENLGRLDLRAEVAAGDGSAPATWWDGRPFDRILLDAPCSATGVIRRHPDIKLLRQPADIDALVERQRALLDALWPLLKPNGILVYATCSVLPRENAEQVRGFIDGRDDVREITIVADWGHGAAAGRQILTGEQGMDGFFYACLQKK